MAAISGNSLLAGNLTGPSQPKPLKNPLADPGQIIKPEWGKEPKNYFPLLRAIWHSENEQEVRFLIDSLSAEELNMWVIIMDHGGGATTPLLQAAHGGKLPIVKMLVEAGAKSYFADPDGYVWPNNALLLAAEGGHPDVVEYLLSQGDPQKKIGTLPREEPPITILKTICESVDGGWGSALRSQGLLDCVRLLATHHATTASDLNEALEAAFMHVPAYMELVKLLISLGAPFPKEALLLKAAKRNRDVMVEFLIREGVNVNYRDPETGVTALHLAAASGRANMVQLLLENGADPEAITTAEYPYNDHVKIESGLNYLQFAKKWKHVQGVDNIRSFINKPGSFHWDADEWVKESLLDIEHINAHLEDGNTLLHKAVEALRLEVSKKPNEPWFYMGRLIRLLMEDGHADPSVPNAQGVTSSQLFSTLEGGEALKKLQAELFPQ